MSANAYTRILALGPKYYFRCGESSGTTLADLTGHSLTGLTVYGSPTINANSSPIGGITGQSSRTLNANTKYFGLSQGDWNSFLAESIANKGFAIVMWHKGGTAANTYFAGSYGAASGSADAFGVYRDFTNRISVTFGTTTGTISAGFTTPTLDADLADNTWHCLQLAVDLEGRFVSAMWDDQVMTSATLSQPASIGTPVGVNGYVVFGGTAGGYGVAPGGNIQGDLAEIAFFTRVLTPNESRAIARERMKRDAPEYVSKWSSSDDKRKRFAVRMAEGLAAVGSILFLGDSTWTSPGGPGGWFCEQMIREVTSRFGSMPWTQLWGIGQASITGPIYDGSTGNTNLQAVTDTPGRISPNRLQTTNTANAFVFIDQNMESLAQDRRFGPTPGAFNIANGFYVDFWIHNPTTQGGVAFDVLSTIVPNNGGGYLIRQVNVASQATVQAQSTTYAKFASAVQRPQAPYTSIRPFALTSTTDAFIRVRTTATKGWSAEFYSRGGSNSSQTTDGGNSFFDNYSSSTPFWAIKEKPRIVYLGWQTNDINAGTTVDQWKANIAAIIAWCRTSLGWTDTYFVVTGGYPARADATLAVHNANAECAAAAYELDLADANVFSFNMYRALLERGFTDSIASTYDLYSQSVQVDVGTVVSSLSTIARVPVAGSSALNQRIYSYFSPNFVPFTVDINTMPPYQPYWTQINPMLADVVHLLERGGISEATVLAEVTMGPLSASPNEVWAPNVWYGENVPTVNV